MKGAKESEYPHMHPTHSHAQTPGMKNGFER